MQTKWSLNVIQVRSALLHYKDEGSTTIVNQEITHGNISEHQVPFMFTINDHLDVE